MCEFSRIFHGILNNVFHSAVVRMRIPGFGSVLVCDSPSYVFFHLFCFIEMKFLLLRAERGHSVCAKNKTESPFVSLFSGDYVRYGDRVSLRLHRILRSKTTSFGQILYKRDRRFFFLVLFRVCFLSANRFVSFCLSLLCACWFLDSKRGEREGNNKICGYQSTSSSCTNVDIDDQMCLNWFHAHAIHKLTQMLNFLHLISFIRYFCLRFFVCVCCCTCVMRWRALAYFVLFRWLRMCHLEFGMLCVMHLWNCMGDEWIRSASEHIRRRPNERSIKSHDHWINCVVAKSHLFIRKWPLFIEQCSLFGHSDRLQLTILCVINFSVVVMSRSSYCVLSVNPACDLVWIKFFSITTFYNRP